MTPTSAMTNAHMTSREGAGRSPRFVSWQPTAHALFSLLALLAPALVGLCAWRWRGKLGAISLAALAWLFALWALVYAAELTAGSAWAVDFACAASLVLMLVNSQRLYARQSLDILMGVAGPWAAYAACTLGLDSGIGPLPGLDPTVVKFLSAGLVLLWGIYRHRLLNISPVAQDAVMEGMSDGTLVLDRRGRIVDLNPSAARCAPSRNATRPALPSP